MSRKDDAKNAAGIPTIRSTGELLSATSTQLKIPTLPRAAEILEGARPDPNAMPDAILRNLWALAIIVRGVSVLICWRRAPNWWLAWAVFSEAAALVMRACDYWHWGWYAQGWMVEQWVSAALLVMVAGSVAKPSLFAGGLSATISLAAVTSLHISQHFKLAWLQFTMEGTGAILLALGIVASFAAAAFHTTSRSILAGYLLISSLMLLVAPEYLASPGLGRAWSLVEVCAFGLWMTAFSGTKVALASESQPRRSKPIRGRSN